MVSIEKLLQVSDELGFNDIATSLEGIKAKMGQDNCPIVLPLVGEFSAGKTTLINALTDCKQLETATVPTTATIYEVNFGSDVCRAEVFDHCGNCVSQTTVISDLKNSALKDASVVKVFDTSTTIPSYVVIVDTPGLSAPDPKHKQALVDYLPNADGILLVSDVNQQITASLIDFTKTVTLANRPVFLVLTMCDLKSRSDIESARHYASSLLEIPDSHVACVAAKKGDVKELLGLIEMIQSDKAAILDRVNQHRVKLIAEQMASDIEKIIESSKLDDSVDDAIFENKSLLSRIKREMEVIVEVVQSEIEEASRASVRKFESVVFDKLDALASRSGIDYDTESVSAIDAMIRIQFGDYKNVVKRIIGHKVKDGFKSEGTISLDGISSIDMDSIQLESVPYNLNLNYLGHEYDSKIATGLKIATAVAATAAVVVTAGAAAPVAGAAGSAGTAVAARGTGVAIEAADMVLDAGSIITTTKLMSKMKRNAEFVNKVKTKYDEIDSEDRSRNGAFQSFIGSITDRSLAKPQRRRAIHQYLDSTLLPFYKQGLESITDEIVSVVSSAISAAVATRVEELSSAISSLQQERNNNESEYNRRISILKQYRCEILNA